MKYSDRLRCYGCAKRFTAPGGLIINLLNRRYTPVCPACSLRCRESSIFLEQMVRCLGLRIPRPELVKQLKCAGRALPTTLAEWDALEAGAIVVERHGGA